MFKYENGAPCKRCGPAGKRGRIKTENWIQLCDYCGLVHDEVPTVPFRDLAPGTLFYTTYHDDELLYKCSDEERQALGMYGALNCYEVGTKKFVGCGPDVRCILFEQRTMVGTRFTFN